MDVLIKVLLSTTLMYAIHFVYKTFTSNNFDKLFMPKYQKYLHNTFLAILVFIIFVAYGVFFALIFEKIKDIKYVNVVINLLIIVYFLGLIITGILNLYKKIKDRNNGYKFVLSGKVADYILFSVFFLNILMFSLVFHEMYFVNGRTESYNLPWLGNLVNCIVLFFTISYFLLKSSLYLQGINKREWHYVLSPTPKDIQEKYLYVLYSLNATTLVLSDDPSNKQYPRSVYLFDLNKNSYTCFNRIVNLHKNS
ncbi:hypothetical protein G3M74_22090 [Paenibacillus polymyxa]|nr:hypothetical protein [Paenibacillus polymyxa]